MKIKNTNLKKNKKGRRRIRRKSSCLGGGDGGDTAKHTDVRSQRGK